MTVCTYTFTNIQHSHTFDARIEKCIEFKWEPTKVEVKKIKMGVRHVPFISIPLYGAAKVLHFYSIQVNKEQFR